MEELTRITPATLDVLAALLDAGTAPVWGLEIIKRTGRPSGSVYPILDRLERAGWTTSAWDDDTTRTGPRRRLYRLTPDGARAARTLRAEHTATRTTPRTARRPRPAPGPA
ncbi:PadR family transcriptional regulator [Allonocardiopsis opalescens]|uniref:PadR family transcriptional regulator n=1 Tax=Allonocardiopsis opalescens TaxID=1144618 RepID=A0A2T0PTT4_9ACTN|nr:PadR family transcriptional regulator [Allonocardiopsis opalescens]PRX92304.1 PadR family transcriptional regulator [Allonocardiopsis opalescens]